MINKLFRPLSDLAVEAKTFIVPRNSSKKTGKNFYNSKYTAVLIPSFKPSNNTYDLVKSIIKWHPKVLIVVIDDCTPLSKKRTLRIINSINHLASENPQVIPLRTPTNSLKAGALNYGISYLMSLPSKPQVVFTFDDDVKINSKTIPFMIQALFSDRNVGAVCSQVRVRNKNKNLLTRMQSLEYHSFNITKIGDNGFLKGPLVMQGMLTAFRMEVLEEVGGFTHGHLIEDYDITARLKDKGWKVMIEQRASAWTDVPETLEDLWKQRVRWTSGGLIVLGQF